VNILVDGDRAAAELEVEWTSKTTRQRFRARLAHFWSFEDGVPVSLVEYMDTALIASQIRS
jgi:ketosteroid isomerase-like protein